MWARRPTESRGQPVAVGIQNEAPIWRGGHLVNRLGTSGQHVLVPGSAVGLVFSTRGPSVTSTTRTRKRARALSDSLNISPRARWVVCQCPLGRTRGHGWQFIYPPRARGEKFKLSLPLGPATSVAPPAAIVRVVKSRLAPAELRRPPGPREA